MINKDCVSMSFVFIVFILKIIIFKIRKFIDSFWVKCSACLIAIFSRSRHFVIVFSFLKHASTATRCKHSHAQQAQPRAAEKSGLKEWKFIFPRNFADFVDWASRKSTNFRGKMNFHSFNPDFSEFSENLD